MSGNVWFSWWISFDSIVIVIYFHPISIEVLQRLHCFFIMCCYYYISSICSDFFYKNLYHAHLISRSCRRKRLIDIHKCFLSLALLKYIFDTVDFFHIGASFRISIGRSTVKIYHKIILFWEISRCDWSISESLGSATSNKISLESPCFPWCIGSWVDNNSSVIMWWIWNLIMIWLTRMTPLSIGKFLIDIKWHFWPFFSFYHTDKMSKLYKIESLSLKLIYDTSK